MITACPLSTLSTLLALSVFIWVSIMVARARGTYGVVAPATSGHPEFDRRFRAQANTQEQLLAMLPALWLCAAWIGDAWAAAGGVVWCAGRVLYALQYLAAPASRGPGFVLTVTPTFAMILAVGVAVLRTLL